jgi:hypothetical protein
LSGLSIGTAVRSLLPRIPRAGAPTIWIADAHRDGKRFIVRTDELLTAFLEIGNGCPSIDMWFCRAKAAVLMKA